MGLSVLHFSQKIRFFVIPIKTKYFSKKLPIKIFKHVKNNDF